MEQIIREAIARAMRIISFKVEAGLIENCPVDTGFLKNSIVAKQTDSGLQVTMAGYGEEIEFGFPAGTPVNPEQLKGWCRRKLGDENLAYPIARYLQRYGRKPNPFIREWFFNNFKEIAQEEIERQLNLLLQQ